MKQLLRVLAVVFSIYSVHQPTVCAIQTELSSLLSDTDVAQGDTITMTIRLSWLGDPHELQIAPLRNLDTYLLEVVDVSQKNTCKMFNDFTGTTVLFTYTLRATEPGKGRISYLALEVTETKTGIKKIKKTQPYDVTILPKSRYLLRQTARGIWYGLIILIIGTAVWGVWRWRNNRTQQRERDSHDRAMLSANAEHETLHALKQARRHKIAGDADLFFNELVSALSTYFEKKHGVSMARSTGLSEEKMESEHGVPRKIMIEYKEIVAAGNRIKFSGRKLTPDELEQWARRAEKIVRYFIDKAKEDHRQRQIDTIQTASNSGGE